MTWIMRANVPSASLKLMTGRSGTPEGCAAIHRDLKRLEKWAERNLNKGKFKVLHLRRNNAMRQYWLGQSIWKEALQKRTWMA